MNTLLRYALRAMCAALLAVLATMPLAGQAPAEFDQLILSGDMAFFFGRGEPGNCTLSSRFKRGDPVGFRMTAVNPKTGKRDGATKVVVHLTYAGRTVDVPMRDRQTEQEPERDFFVAKWIVPDDTPIGVIRYTVTATDPQGRTGEWKPFDVEASQLTIVE